MNCSKKENSKKNKDTKESDFKLNNNESDSKLDDTKESDFKLDPPISDECKKELQEIRAEIKKGKYIELKNVKDLARRCGLKK